MNRLCSLTNGDFNWPDLLEAAKQRSFAARCQSIPGRRILITGAGGSIGSALTRSVAALAPQNLVLLEASEDALYKVDRDLKAAAFTRQISILGDINDEAGLLRLFESHQPEIVLHAAAFKHVPLMEENPFAAVANNAVGTYILAKTAANFKTLQLLLVSTDKAASPASIMGVSKRVAELVALSITGARPDMIASALRLGNVLGSGGSVLPRFLDQIAAGGPITVTHPDAKRYLMTMHQVVESIFAAIDLPHGPALLVPELGEQRSILDLARHLQKLHSSSAEIVFTGLMPGEKLEESLLSKDEVWENVPTDASCSLRSVSGPRPTWGFVESAIAEINRAITLHDLPLLIHVLTALVPEYQPSALLEAPLRSPAPVDAHTLEPEPAAPWLA